MQQMQPGVVVSLPMLLDIFKPEVVAERTAHAPARIFGIDRRGFIRPGYLTSAAVDTCSRCSRALWRRASSTALQAAE